MDNFDETWLSEVGLMQDRTPAERQAFLAHLSEEREVRVGQQLAVGLPEEKVAEFERIINGDEPTITATIGNYHESPIYKAMISVGGFTPDTDATKRELASLLWLNTNRPDYQELINKVTADLKAQVVASKNKI
ncbi:DUF5663 domain-containing protein [Candidatus Saccharibacteria bacterium]|nr:DUF5663 domain-containing protein [Candidatus Saccharibacteria bacterium]